MKPSIERKLQSVAERYQELSLLLSEPDVINDQKRYRDYSKEYAHIEPLVKCFQHYCDTVAALDNARELLKEDDADMRELAHEEIKDNALKIEALEKELQILLLPRDQKDNCDVYLEVRAGTGGDEAAIFAGDLCRMYTRFAEHKKWRVEVLNQSFGEHGGYKEVVLKVSGNEVYSQLKFESGAHRVQRVPETESQGRVHTSACTVAILPEVDEISDIEINPADLKIDTFRASGAGGQHVNKTDSAIRITHLPTGVVVECQDERSQHKNRARALSVLKAKLLDAEQQKQRQEQAATRKSLVGSGDRSERIRTYNYPQGRVTDHRINLTLYKLDEIMQGSLEMVIEPLISEYHADLLASISE